MAKRKRPKSDRAQEPAFTTEWTYHGPDGREVPLGEGLTRHGRTTYANDSDGGNTWEGLSAWVDHWNEAHAHGVMDRMESWATRTLEADGIPVPSTLDEGERLPETLAVHSQPWFAAGVLLGISNVRRELAAAGGDLWYRDETGASPETRARRHAENAVTLAFGTMRHFMMANYKHLWEKDALTVVRSRREGAKRASEGGRARAAAFKTRNAEMKAKAWSMRRTGVSKDEIVERLTTIYGLSRGRVRKILKDLPLLDGCPPAPDADPT